METVQHYLQDLKRAERLVQRGKELLNQKNSFSSGTTETRKLASIRGLIAELNEQRYEMETLIEHINSHQQEGKVLPPGQIEFLRKMSIELTQSCTKLQSICDYISATQKNETSRTEATLSAKRALHEATVPYQNHNANAALDMSDFPNINNANLQESLYFQQEKQLDMLQGKVASVKTVSHKIGDEIRLHTSIIDGTIRGVDTAQDRLSRARRFFDWSARQDRFTWVLVYITIILCIALLLILIFVP